MCFPRRPMKARGTYLDLDSETAIGCELKQYNGIYDTTLLKPFRVERYKQTG